MPFRVINVAKIQSAMGYESTKTDICSFVLEAKASSIVCIII